MVAPPAPDEDAQAKEKALIEATIRAKEEELQALDELRREGGGLFQPRLSLARTPPQAFSTPPLSLMDSSPPCAETPLLPQAGEKRHLASPEEVQEAMRRRVANRRREVPPIGGILAAEAAQPRREECAVAATASAVQLGEADSLVAASVELLAGLATSSTRGIMEAVRSKTSKLNKDEIAAIGAHAERLGAVVTHLTLRLAAAEAAMQRRADAAPGPACPADGVVVRSFANALRLGRDSAPVPIARAPGPSVAIYPAEHQKENIKTAEDTRRALQTAVQPALLGLQIAGIRKVGNAGVVVQTTSVAAAERLRKAVPDTLRTAEPAARQPLIALTGIDKSTTTEELVSDLKTQNLHQDEKWTQERIAASLRVLFKRDRHNGRTKWVCQCSNDLRHTLINKGRVFVGWDVVEVTDHLSVTCCSKCQLYGHPEKYCRAKATTCGNCGEEGHRGTECKSVVSACATCKRFGRRGAGDHRTASRDCPARAHAEQRQVTDTNYGQ